MIRPNVDPVGGDFLKTRLPSDAFDIAIMNPPYGFVGKGKARQAADRMHVQHALRMAPEVVVLARANFLWGQERYQQRLQDLGAVLVKPCSGDLRSLGARRKERRDSKRRSRDSNENCQKCDGVRVPFRA